MPNNLFALLLLGTSTANGYAVADPTQDQCFDTSDCFLKGATCTCCVKKYAYKEYSDEVCFSYYSSVEATDRPPYPTSPCFDTSDCFSGSGTECYCCRKDRADGYKEYSDEYCFAYGASYNSEDALGLADEDRAPQNQGQCGSCWAFSSTEQLSARILHSSGTTLDEWGYVLSAEVPVAFYGQYSSGLTGCNGGWPEDAGNVFKDRGVPEVGCAAYVSADCEESSTDATDGCTDGQYSEGTCYSDPSRTWHTWGRYSSAVISQVQKISGAQSMMEDIAANGPLTGVFTVYNNFFGFDFSGGAVYTATSGDAAGGHAVLIVGYGDTDEGVPFWLVRNSWGASWGDNGYFRIQRGTNLCNIETDAVSYIMSEPSTTVAAANSPKAISKALDVPRLQSTPQPAAASENDQRRGQKLKPGGWMPASTGSLILQEASSAYQRDLGAAGHVHNITTAATQVVAGLNVYFEATIIAASSVEAVAPYAGGAHGRRVAVVAHRPLAGASLLSGSAVSPSFQILRAKEIA